jgi:hypothetical protein
MSSSPFRRRCAPLIAAAALLLSFEVAAHDAPSAVSVDVYDRTQREPLSVYWLDLQRYVVGVPGHEYAIRIRNTSGQRILAVTSVDGVNVVTGATASPDQSGYVIDAGGSVEIAGWRRSLEKTSAFYFTDLGDSYAARTGRPQNVGVIGVAIFNEVARTSVSEALRDKLAAHENVPEPARAERAPGALSSTQRAAAANAASAPDNRPRLMSAPLGTGFGRDELSAVQRVRFDRATTSPAETITIRYDRRENLIALGVLPQPRYAQRSPDPFPAMQFVPAPR